MPVGEAYLAAVVAAIKPLVGGGLLAKRNSMPCLGLVWWSPIVSPGGGDHGSGAALDSFRPVLEN